MLFDRRAVGQRMVRFGLLARGVERGLRGADRIARVGDVLAGHRARFRDRLTALQVV